MNIRETINSHLDEIVHSTYVVVNLPTGSRPCELSEPRFLTNSHDLKHSVYCIGYFKNILQVLYDERVPKHSTCLFSKSRIDDSVRIDVM